MNSPRSLWAALLLAVPVAAQSTVDAVTSDRHLPATRADGPAGALTPPIDWQNYQPVVANGAVGASPAGFVNEVVTHDVRTGATTSSAVPASLPGPLPGEETPGSGPIGPVPELVESFGNPTTITTESAWPWRAQVRVFGTFDGSGFICSGTLVDPRTVLVAGHCLHTGAGGVWAQNVVVAPAWDGDSDAYGTANGINFQTYTAWTNNSDLDWDIGWIRLDRPVGTLTGWYGYGYNDTNSFFTGNSFNHAGYPGCSDGCWPSFAGCPNVLIFGNGAMDFTSTHRLGTNLATGWNFTPGMSGSSIYRVSGSSRTCYGAYSTWGWNGCQAVWSEFCRMTQPKYDGLGTFVDQAYAAALDIAALDTNVAATTVMAGGRIPELNVLFFNNSSANPGTANYGLDVRLSTNDLISTGDTLIGTANYDWNFGPQSNVRVNLGSPRLPFGTPSGSRWVGILNTTSDANAGNDGTSGWDAHAITVIPTPTQLAFDSFLGAPINAGDDSIITRGLPFTFTWPDGTTSTAIDIDSNGRILPPGSDSSDFTESTGELLSGPTALCPLWDDLTPDGATNTGDIHFRATPSRAIITWSNVQQYNTDQDFTFQVQLRSDGRIAYIYDNRVDADGIVGLTGGNGATGSSTDLTTQPATNANTDTLFQQFTNDNDLAGRVVQFNPGPNGDWITRVTSSSIPLPPEATNLQVGRAATSSFTILPGVFGTYFGNACVNCWEGVVGLDLGMGDDTIANTPLGFTFTFPDGTAVTSVDVDSNGRILPPNSDTSDFTPSVGEMLSGPAALYPLHTDLSPQNGGSVRVYQGPGFTTITWWNVPQFGESNALTFQATLRPDNTVTFSYRDITEFEPKVALVGNARGNGQTDPGESDLTSLSSSFTNYYEFFDVPGGDILDLQMSIQADTTPRMGNPWDLRLEGVSPNATLAALLFGFSNPNLSLDGLPGLGLDGCVLLCNPAVPAIPMILLGEAASVSIGIDSSTDWVGLTLYAQGAVIAPGTTPLGVELSDAQRGVVGY